MPNNSIFIGELGGSQTSGSTIFPIGSNAIIEIDGIAVTSTDGLVLKNTTPSTVGVPVQQSPRIRLSGTAFNSSGGTSSETDDWIIEAVPATAAGATSAQLNFSRSIAGGAFAQRLSITSGGSLTLQAGTYSIYGSTRVGDGGTDGKMRISNNALTAGVGLDVTTDALLKVRTTAQSAYATVDALNYLQGGVLLTSSTAPSVASGFGSGAAVAHSNGTAAFTVGVGTTTGTTGVITMPSAPNGWAAQCTNITTQSTTVAYTKQTATSQTSITIGCFSDIAGAHAWADNDVVSIVAFPY